MYQKTIIRHRKMWLLSFCALILGVLATMVAKLLVLAISLFTNLSYKGIISLEEINVAHVDQQLWHLFLPVIGGLIVGFMARFGSQAIRGHGIPEVMEKILTGDSRIPRRMTILKPLSSAIAIGTGGPFGAEGPIIATGGSLGSWLGRHFLFTSNDRKILLATGAAAGMTAIFGTPLAAVLLCIELLLFEYSSKSFIPVIIGVSVAQALRLASGHTEPVFPIFLLSESFGLNQIFYFFAGAFSAAFGCLITKMISAIENLFEKLPIHWMWWPALGGIVVGVVGYIEPRSLSVGYINITQALQGNLLLGSALALFFWKLISWSVALSSGTSGGTLAPLLTLGSSLGVIIAILGQLVFPELDILIKITALVCMSSMFTGATRAVLTSIFFTIEATGTHTGIVPLMLGNCAAYLISSALMRDTIMTEKIIRRGVHVPDEFFSIKVSERAVK